MMTTNHELDNSDTQVRQLSNRLLNILHISYTEFCHTIFPNVVFDTYQSGVLTKQLCHSLMLMQDSLHAVFEYQNQGTTQVHLLRCVDI